MTLNTTLLLSATVNSTSYKLSHFAFAGVTLRTKTKSLNFNTEIVKKNIIDFFRRYLSRSNEKRHKLISMAKKCFFSDLLYASSVDICVEPAAACPYCRSQVYSSRIQALNKTKHLYTCSKKLTYRFSRILDLLFDGLAQTCFAQQMETAMTGNTRIEM